MLKYLLYVIILYSTIPILDVVKDLTQTVTPLEPDIWPYKKSQNNFLLDFFIPQALYQCMDLTVTQLLLYSCPPYI